MEIQLHKPEENSRPAHHSNLVPWQLLCQEADTPGNASLGSLMTPSYPNDPEGW
jgi:hypothetical protein